MFVVLGLVHNKKVRCMNIPPKKYNYLYNQYFTSEISTCPVVLFACLFVCFESVTAFVPRGQLPRTYGELPYNPGHSLPRASLLFMSLSPPPPPPPPPYLWHASCIRLVPSPVLLSCTDILPSIWSAPSLSSCVNHFGVRVIPHAGLLLVIPLVKKGYGLVSARSQPYRTRPEPSAIRLAERRYQAVSPFYKDNEFIISFFLNKK